MTAVAQREAIPEDPDASQQIRWDRWESRYERSSRKTMLRARVVAVIVFAAIAANLLVQLLSSPRV